MDEDEDGLGVEILLRLICVLGFIAATAIFSVSLWGITAIDFSHPSFLVIFGSLWCVLGMIGGVVLGMFSLFGMFNV